MTKQTVFKNTPVWVRLTSVGLAAAHAPPTPGIYAYASSASLHGLPCGLDWVYVGQAKSLRARFSFHTTDKETNPGLRSWLKGKARREVWYASIPLEDLDQVERDLIVKLQPRFNRIRYANHGDNNRNQI